MKSIKELWDELKALSAARKGTDKRPWRLRCDDISNSILLYISSHWTVQEILDFKEAWDNSGKFQPPPKPAETAGLKAWGKWLTEAARTDYVNIRMTCVLKAIAQCALISIGAKCYADCKRDSVAVALTLDIEPYFRQTPNDIDNTMPNSIVNAIRGILKNKQTDSENLLDDLQDGLQPNTKKKDALAYMAHLVCHVWIAMPGKSKSKALDYVFETAKDGDRLWSDCQYARRLRNMYNYNSNTISKEAAILHSIYNTWHRKSKKPYQPNIWRELVKESKRKERKSRRR